MYEQHLKTKSPAKLVHIKLLHNIILSGLHSAYSDTKIIDMLQRSWLKVADKESVAAAQYSTSMDSPKLSAN